MITAKQLQEKADRAYEQYNATLEEYTKENLQRMVHDYCFKYKLDFANGMGTWIITSYNINSWGGFNPDHDNDHILTMFEELECDCEEFRQEAHQDIQRLVRECGYENSKQLLDCVIEGKPIFDLLNESACRNSSWGELVEPYKYERFPEHISK